VKKTLMPLDESHPGIAQGLRTMIPGLTVMFVAMWALLLVTVLLILFALMESAPEVNTLTMRLACLATFLAGWQICVKGVAAVRRALTRGMGRRYLTAALASHALLPAALLALLDADLAKGALLASGAALIVLTGTLAAAGLGLREIARDAGRQPEMKVLRHAFVAACVLVFLAGAAQIATAFEAKGGTDLDSAAVRFASVMSYVGGMIALSRLRVLALALLDPEWFASRRKNVWSSRLRRPGR
jgi:hypothetical protein